MSTEIAISLISAIFVSNGFWTLILSRLDKKDSKSKAILALLHDKLYSLCEKHIQAGAISVEELENLTYLFEPYSELGGNGTCEHLYSECKKLPKK